MNRLKQLREKGQSVWLDTLSRGLMDSGGLERLIEEDGLAGVTTNPSIFQKAVASGKDYDSDLRAHKGERVEEAFEAVAVSDVRRACGLFLGVHERTGGEDGFVSLEVSPRLARDEAATVEEARRLWRAVDRPNLLVKVPGTREGLGAMRTLIGEGISVNVTLLFSTRRYAEVRRAWFDGLEALAASGGDLRKVASVASFFVSRVDTAVDALLDAKGASELRGKAATANAKLAFQGFLEDAGSARWKALAAKGARPQRPLWASTSAKDPSYRDVLYVEELVGGPTVNTMPLETLEAFRDHGEARESLAEDVEGARALLARLEGLGIRVEEVAGRLEEEGIRKFAEAYDALLKGVEEKRRVLA